VLATALLALSACGGNSSDSSSKPKASSASPPSSAASGGGAQIKVASTSQGSVLTDDKGRVLYMFNPDNRGASVCYDQCAAAWPPVLTTGKPTAATGADASLLGTTTRKDGKTQVTYNKYPLYTFAFDAKPGDTNGQAVKSIWWVLDKAGVPQEQPAKVAVAAAPKLGKILVDVKGETLYMLTADKKNKSSCTGDCLKAWVPVHTFGAPTAGTGAKAGLLGSSKFAPGVDQVTYKGHPLYFSVADQAPGDAKGQGLNGRWYALDAAGAANKKAP
jgi:predicted lipoprotein with Yx(FWY)xxD motif